MGFKMKNLMLLLIFLSLLTNCKKNIHCNDDELTLERMNYTGNQLNIDGYYYGDADSNNSMPFANIYYLYRNGVFFTSEASDLDKAEAGTITVDFENFFGKTVKGAWGVFQINGNNIEIERWRSRTNGCEITIYERGDILNDSTFVINKREYRNNGKAEKVETPNSIFYFRSLTEKPDSTNNYIK